MGQVSYYIMPRVINSDRDYSGATLCAAAGGATHSILVGIPGRLLGRVGSGQIGTDRARLGSIEH